MKKLVVLSCVFGLIMNADAQLLKKIIDKTKQKTEDKVSEKVHNFESLSNPIRYVSTAMFFIKGKGIHKDQLTSFELALRDAKISD